MMPGTADEFLGANSSEVLPCAREGTPPVPQYVLSFRYVDRVAGTLLDASDIPWHWGEDRTVAAHAMRWASLSLQGDVAYGQCRFLRSVATQANPPPYSVPVAGQWHTIWLWREVAT